MKTNMRTQLFFSCFVWKLIRHNYSSHVLSWENNYSSHVLYENIIILLMFLSYTNMRTELFFSCFVIQNMKTIILLMFCMMRRHNYSSHVLYKTWEEHNYSSHVLSWQNMRRIILLVFCILVLFFSYKTIILLMFCMKTNMRTQLFFSWEE